MGRRATHAEAGTKPMPSAYALFMSAMKARGVSPPRFGKLKRRIVGKKKHCRPEEKDLYINEAKDNYKRNEIKKQDCCRWWRSVYYSKPDEKQEEDTDSLERCFTLGTIPFTMSEEIKVEKELGQGTYGRIFLCNWLGCTVALKVPHRKFSSDQAPSHPEVSEGPASEAFRSADLAREHALMTSLAGHPNICRTFQLLNLEDGVIALAMEVAQSDLLALCKKLRR
ncbi:Serine/threonine-protein kinase DCLK3, partial [Durusdinium trenchii]